MDDTLKRLAGWLTCRAPTSWLAALATRAWLWQLHARPVSKAAAIAATKWARILES